MINAELLSCSCCGAGVHDTPEENASHGEVPYPHDTGYGMCLGCGGNPNGKTTKERMGWGMTCFFEARIAKLAAALNEKNRKHFLGLSFAKQCRVIEKAVTEGMMT